MEATQITPEELTAFHRFCECGEDGEGHDVGKEMMRRLRAVGLVVHCGGGWHQTTDLGNAIRDAATE